MNLFKNYYINSELTHIIIYYNWIMSSNYSKTISFKSKPTNIAPHTDMLGLSDCKNHKPLICICSG